MDSKKQRRVSAVFGVFLILVASVVVVLAGGSFLRSPVLAVQVLLLATAGVFDVAAGFETRLTERFAWYKLSGLGYVSLGLSLPFGLADTTGMLPLFLGALGGLSLAGMGIDMLLFDGKHVYSEPLSG